MAALRFKNIFIPYHNISSIRLDGFHIHVLTKKPHTILPFSERQLSLTFKSNEDARSEYEYLTNNIIRDQNVITTPDYKLI